VSINGFEVFVDVWSGYDLPAGEGVGWRLDIRCKRPGPGGYFTQLWYGYKSKGYTPTGTYVLDQIDANIDNPCAASEICCITIE